MTGFEFALYLMCLAVLGVVLTTRSRWGVMRMLRDGTIITDQSRDSFTFTFLGAHVWVARFGRQWRARYPTTWAFGLRSKVWFYTPRRAADG